jgi:hypothetical protein
MIYLLTVSLTESQQFLSNTQRTSTNFEMYHRPTTFSLLICSPVRVLIQHILAYVHHWDEPP